MSTYTDIHIHMTVLHTQCMHMQFYSHTWLVVVDDLNRESKLELERGTYVRCKIEFVFLYIIVSAKYSFISFFVFLHDTR